MLFCFDFRDVGALSSLGIADNISSGGKMLGVVWKRRPCQIVPSQQKHVSFVSPFTEILFKLDALKRVQR